VPSATTDHVPLDFDHPVEFPSSKSSVKSICVCADAATHYARAAIVPAAMKEQAAR
jgi:hypothetical protein